MPPSGKMEPLGTDGTAAAAVDEPSVDMNPSAIPNADLFAEIAAEDNAIADELIEQIAEEEARMMGDMVTQHDPLIREGAMFSENDLYITASLIVFVLLILIAICWARSFPELRLRPDLEFIAYLTDQKNQPKPDGGGGSTEGPSGAGTSAAARGNETESQRRRLLSAPAGGAVSYQATDEAVLFDAASIKPYQTTAVAGGSGGGPPSIPPPPGPSTPVPVPPVQAGDKSQSQTKRTSSTTGSVTSSSSQAGTQERPPLPPRPPGTAVLIPTPIQK